MADENQNNAEITQSINGLKTAIQSLLAVRTSLFNMRVTGRPGHHPPCTPSDSEALDMQPNDK